MKISSWVFAFCAVPAHALEAVILSTESRDTNIAKAEGMRDATGADRVLMLDLPSIYSFVSTPAEGDVPRLVGLPPNLGAIAKESGWRMTHQLEQETEVAVWVRADQTEPLSTIVSTSKYTYSYDVANLLSGPGIARVETDSLGACMREVFLRENAGCSTANRFARRYADSFDVELKQYSESISLGPVGLYLSRAVDAATEARLRGTVIEYPGASRLVPLSTD